jgi:hypothetical protein
MDINDPTIVSLQATVDLLCEEIDEASRFHENWKPTAYDAQLHGRMGKSFATKAFLAIRWALRVQTLLALMRIWDKHPDTIGLYRVAKILKDEGVIRALAVERARRFGDADVAREMEADLAKRATDALVLIDKYLPNGTHSEVLEQLRTLRDKRWAHHDRDSAERTAGTMPGDAEIESFYLDTLRVVQFLKSFALATAYDPKEGADVYGYYARFFWASVRGEHTEGHPNYRPPPGNSPAN